MQSGLVDLWSPAAKCKMEDEKRERSALMTGSLGGRVKMKEVRFSLAEIMN